MRIGIDIRCLLETQYSGISEYTLNLLRALLAIDRRNEYLLFYNSAKRAKIPEFSRPNVKICAFRYPNKLFNFGLKFLKFPKIDTLLGGCDIFFLPTFHFLALSNKPKIHLAKYCDRKILPDGLQHYPKLLLVIHDLSFECYPEFFSPKARLWHWLVNPKKLCQRADKIIAISENTKNDIVQLYKISPEKIKVIYPGVGPEFQPAPLNSNRLQSGSPFSLFSLPTPFPPAKPLPKAPSAAEGSPTLSRAERSHPDLFVPPIAEGLRLVKQKYHLPDEFILYLGNLEPRKNLESLIEAVASSSLLPPLVVAGAPGYQSHRLHKFVRPVFLGYIDPADKPALYNLATVFAYPSFYEGFGLPVLEAMACGTPVVTSHAASLPEVAGQAAVTVDPDDVSDLKNALEKVYTDKPLQLHLKAQGISQAKKFSWQNCALELLNEFNHFIN